MNNFRIATTALTGRIMMGRVSKSGLDFIGTPVDVTSDVMKAVIDKFGDGKVHQITSNGIPEWEITVRSLMNG